MAEPWPADLTPEEKRVLLDVLAALRQMTHGHVQITVQDARVVQIDRTHKHRYALTPKVRV
jgi:hypothetical protein